MGSMVGRSGSFAGKTAIITGGASGIGLALGAELVAQHARVVLADIDAVAVGRVADELASSAGGSASIVGRWLDVRDRDAVRSLIDEIAARDGNIDLVFNNAGLAMGGPTHELTGQHWDCIIDVNLRGVVNGVLAAYPRMIEQGNGHIVNTASGAGLVAPPLVVPYATTKHAVVGLSTGLRPEAALHGVRVSVLCPGAVETAILDRLPPSDLPVMASAPVTAREYLQSMRQHPMPADRFARAALGAIARNKAIIVVPRSAKALWYLHRLSPALAERISRSMAATVTRDLVHPA
jgi:NAD(P)-dependent dehydrogenase (short-subunit alcohol dehydrogenase family)